MASSFSHLVIYRWRNGTFWRNVASPTQITQWFLWSSYLLDELSYLESSSTIDVINHPKINDCILSLDLLYQNLDPVPQYITQMYTWINLHLWIVSSNDERNMLIGKQNRANDEIKEGDRQSIDLRRSSIHHHVTSSMHISVASPNASVLLGIGFYPKWIAKLKTSRI